MQREDSSSFSKAIFQIADSKSVMELRNLFEKFIVYRTPQQLITSSKYFISAYSQFKTRQLQANSTDYSSTHCLCGSSRPAGVCCDQIFDKFNDLGQSWELKKNFGNAEQKIQRDNAVHREKVVGAMRVLFEELLQELLYCKRSESWQRRQISADVIHYTNENNVKSPKALIVGLAGIGQRLMMPNYKVLRYIDSLQFDVLFLRDRTRRNFAYGIDGCEFGLDSIADYVSRFCKERDYNRLIAIGISGGAIPAIYLAYRNEFDKVLAVGPPPLNSQKELTHYLQSIVSISNPKRLPSVILSYSSNISRDIEAANQVIKVIEHAIDAPEPQALTHNIIHDLHKIGALRGYFDRHLFSGD